MPTYLIIIIIDILVLFILGFISYKSIQTASKKKIESLENEAKEVLVVAKKEAEATKKESILEAKEEVHKLRTDLDRDSRERRNELQRLERRLIQREELLDKKSDALQKKDDALNERIVEIDNMEVKVKELAEQRRTELERISGLTSEDAKQILLDEIKKEITHDAALMIKDIEGRAKEEADKKAREIVTTAIQRCAADHVSETTVQVVALPNDEMKGRIIGREGRNIRTLETLTGVDLIIDDTPEAVILSSFDPIRREVARMALEKLIVDGRIHPARIEEMVEKSQRDVENEIKEEGEQAALETSVHGLHPEIIRLLGRLKYRTSYGQNVLKHSIEVSYLAGLMASELGLDVTLARRAGLLHDIGKAVDQEQEGPHALIGGDLAKRYHESPIVVNAIAAHHGDVEMESLEAILVQAADAISAARPGARRETLEAYIKRLEKLEEIANSYEGVEKSYAIQAGREIRIIVKPDHVDDVGAVELARNIVKSVEEQLEYPGQIKINVIRETRAVDFAK
ncbi:MULTISPECIES: ribonuclease Y [Clostridium]|uniref:Ribonuclease Y n=1 Tax=Clostridium cibarium TaxID=2762247 RepID=A0ABR8PQL6_9CLOT|nr:ribonuclease Y [Clostridium sp. HBUAS56017]MBD7910469.1 ribonuclease Y [Clostridium cibarium]